MRFIIYLKTDRWRFYIIIIDEMKEILGRKYLISLSYLFIVLVGVIAWLNIPVEMAPDLRLPSVTVSYTLGSTSPEVMEQEVTRRVEAVATRLRNVEQIRSVSQEGRSSRSEEHTSELQSR